MITRENIGMQLEDMNHDNYVMVGKIFEKYDIIGMDEIDNKFQITINKEIIPFSKDCGLEMPNTDKKYNDFFEACHILCDFAKILYTSMYEHLTKKANLIYDKNLDFLNYEDKDSLNKMIGILFKEIKNPTIEEFQFLCKKYSNSNLEEESNQELVKLPCFNKETFQFLDKNLEEQVQQERDFLHIVDCIKNGTIKKKSKK